MTQNGFIIKAGTERLNTMEICEVNKSVRILGSGKKFMSQNHQFFNQRIEKPDVLSFKCEIADIRISWERYQLITDLSMTIYQS